MNSMNIYQNIKFATPWMANVRSRNLVTPSGATKMYGSSFLTLRCNVLPVDALHQYDAVDMSMFSSAPMVHLNSDPRTIILQSFISSVGAYVAAVWPTRPRGWARKDLLQVEQSPVAGKGVFAVAPIPSGTVLGGYPGRLRTIEQMRTKCKKAPNAEYYCFKNQYGRFLDPTDEEGNVTPAPKPGLPWLPINVTLAYVNEPPLGGKGTNATVIDDPKDAEGLIFVAQRDIDQGEEIFIDYFTDYDRSNYVGKN